VTVQDCLATKKVKPILEKCNTLFRLLKVKRPTRWNSAYYMVDRISITKVVIVSVLLNTPKGLKPLTSDEISILEDLKAILSPFEHATVHTSSSISVTVSSVIPVVCGILHNLTDMKTKLQTKVGQDV